MILDIVKKARRLVLHYGDAIRRLTIIDDRKLYSVWEQRHLRRLLAYLRVDCVFDIGANEGQYAEMLRRKAGFKGYIFSFEPNPSALAVLSKKAANDSKWIVTGSAISDADGSQPFNVMADSQFSSLSTPRHDEVSLFHELNIVQARIDVTTERLETAYRRLRSAYPFKCPFLKMDTQGFDVLIVRSSRDVLREFVGLQSELSIAGIYTNSVDFREAISEYENCDFALSAFVPNNAGHFPRLIEVDCIMIRKDLVAHA